MNLATDLNPNYDCIIIGAGIAGLVAAYEIYKRDPSLNILLLEGKNRIGGQIMSDVIGELGARWIAEDHRHILKLCNELNVQLFTHKHEKNLKNISDLEKDLFWSPFVKFELKRFLSMVDVICQDTRMFSMLADSMDDFICRHLFFNSGRNIVRLVVRSVCGVNPDEVSVREFLSICDSWMGCTTLFRSLTGDIEDKRILIPNFSTLIERLEAQIDEDMIMKNQIVRNVIQYNGFVRLQTQTNQTFLTRFVIFAIPQQLIPRITFIPALPENFSVYRPPHFVTSFCANYSSPYWKLQGYSGTTLCQNQQIVTYESRESTISGLVYHKNFENDSELFVRSLLMRYLVQNFGIAMNEPRLWIQTTWEQSQILNGPIDCAWNRIIWTSTYESGAYKGFANGSVQSGKNAALMVLLGLRPQLVNWKDINDVRPANVVKKRIGWMKRFLVSINLYNSVYYGLTTPICSIGLYYLCRKCFIKSQLR